MIKYNGENSIKKLLVLLKDKFETKVDKVEGKGLSTNDFTNDLKTKLDGIEAGAQVNVQSDWNAEEGDAFIKNKPTLGALAAKSIVAEVDLDTTLKEKINASAEGNHAHENKTVLDGITADKVTAWDAAEKNAKDHADAKVQELAEGAVAEVTGKVTTLVGEDANKSVRTIANEELAKQLIPGDAKESLNELTEIAAWIQQHPEDASAMNAAILALQNQLKDIPAGEGTVKKYVDDAITALKIGDYAKAADLTALAARVTALEGKVDTGEKTVTAYVTDYVAAELVEYTDEEVEAIWNQVFTA